MKNNIKFIGTGSGKTSLNRFHSSLLLNYDNKSILIDAGDSISRALLINKIDFNVIDTILISHFHADHFCGLPSLLAQMYISKRERDLTIFVHFEFLEQIKNFVNQAYLFEEVLPFQISFKAYSFDKDVYFSENFSFAARQNSHVNNKHNLTNYDSIKFISSSFLFKFNHKKIFYTADIGVENDLYLFDLQNVNVLISEITHIEKESFPKILQNFSNLKIYLTHINEDSPNDLIEWKSNLTNSFSQRVIIANDGMQIPL